MGQQDKSVTWSCINNKAPDNFPKHTGVNNIEPRVIYHVHIIVISSASPYQRTWLQKSGISRCVPRLAPCSVNTGLHVSSSVVCLCCWPKHNLSGSGEGFLVSKQGTGSQKGSKHSNVNTLVPGRLKWNFRKVNFYLNLVLDGWGISCEITVRWLSLDLSDDKLTSVQVMCML